MTEVGELDADGFERVEAGQAQMLARRFEPLLRPARQQFIAADQQRDVLGRRRRRVGVEEVGDQAAQRLHVDRSLLQP